MFLKNRNIISKIKRSKVTDYAALTVCLYVFTVVMNATNSIIDFHTCIVGEPKSRIVQKHTFFASERYTAGILYTDSLNSA